MVWKNRIIQTFFKIDINSLNGPSPAHLCKMKEGWWKAWSSSFWIRSHGDTCLLQKPAVGLSHGPTPSTSVSDPVVWQMLPWSSQLLSRQGCPGTGVDEEAAAVGAGAWGRGGLGRDRPKYWLCVRSVQGTLHWCRVMSHSQHSCLF